MNVSAIIVTRGDVDLAPVLDSLPPDWEALVWWNGHTLTRCSTQERKVEITVDVPDFSVYGRYAAIEYASHDLIYVQDDDVIVSYPQAIVEEWMANGESPGAPDGKGNGHLVANMPQEFRHDGYTDSCLVGFGACFHRDAPGEAFRRFAGGVSLWEMVKAPPDIFKRTCDVVFTALTPRVLVDIGKANRSFATDESRMYRQPGHLAERTWMLELARQVRDS